MIYLVSKSNGKKPLKDKQNNIQIDVISGE